jgi:hypothetical protein
MVPSCDGKNQDEQSVKVMEKKAERKIVYKVIDGYHKRETADEPGIYELYPFAQNQPKWVIQVLKDSYNLRAPYDVIKFFNQGGELAFKEEVT